MFRSVILFSFAVLAVGCTGQATPPPPAGETIEVNPRDLQRLQARFGQKLEGLTSPELRTSLLKNGSAR
jgi:hypothetical protein